MSRRYTCSSGDYPEHLNPFREEHDSDSDYIKNKFNTVGRRKLKAVLNLTSWTGTLFPTKKTKPADKEVTVIQNSSRTKFLTMTPKISRDLLQRLSQKTKRGRSSSPSSNASPSRDQVYSFSDFKITPKSSREKFARNPSRDERDEVERASYLWESPRRDAASPCSPTTPISEVSPCDYYDLSEEIKHTKQGAKPKKKRQAPLPPPVSETTAAGHKQDNTTAEIAETSVSSESASPEPQRDGDETLTEQSPESQRRGEPLTEQSPESSVNTHLGTPELRGEGSLP